MANVAHERVKRAMSRIRELSADEEPRRLAFVRERALRDEVSFLNDARREGEQLGIEKGKVKGEAKMLKVMIESKFGSCPGWAQDKLNAADSEQLAAWGKQLFLASTLESLLSD